MIAFLSGLSLGATALLAGIAAAGYGQRHKTAGIRHAGHPQPCRRCGARN